jgi:hypothetical protein
MKQAGYRTLVGIGCLRSDGVRHPCSWLLRRLACAPQLEFAHIWSAGGRRARYLGVLDPGAPTNLLLPVNRILRSAVRTAVVLVVSWCWLAAGPILILRRNGCLTRQSPFIPGAAECLVTSCILRCW